MGERMTEEKKQIELYFDLSSLKFSDWRLVLDAGNGRVSADLLDMIERSVVGGKEVLDALPFTAMEDVIRAFGDAIKAATNPPDTSGKASTGGSKHISG